MNHHIGIGRSAPIRSISGDAQAITLKAPTVQRQLSDGIPGIVEIENIRNLIIGISADQGASEGVAKHAVRGNLLPASTSCQLPGNNIGYGGTPAVSGDQDSAMRLVGLICREEIPAQDLYNLRGCLIEALMVISGSKMEVAVPLCRFRCASHGHHIDGKQLTVNIHVFMRNGETDEIAVRICRNTAVIITVDCGKAHIP